MSGGVERAAKRLAEHRKAQSDRLINAVEAGPSRQVIRRSIIRHDKMPIGMSRREWHREMGYPK